MQVLQTVTKEKETTKEHYESLLEKEKQLAEEREFAMKKEFNAKLTDLEEQCAVLREQLEQRDPITVSKLSSFNDLFIS